jgi:hypothetical protein
VVQEGGEGAQALLGAHLEGACARSKRRHAPWGHFQRSMSVASSPARKSTHRGGSGSSRAKRAVSSTSRQVRGSQAARAARLGRSRATSSGYWAARGGASIASWSSPAARGASSTTSQGLPSRLRDTSAGTTVAPSRASARGATAYPRAVSNRVWKAWVSRHRATGSRSSPARPRRCSKARWSPRSRCQGGLLPSPSHCPRHAPQVGVEDRAEVVLGVEIADVFYAEVEDAHARASFGTSTAASRSTGDSTVRSPSSTQVRRAFSARATSARRSSKRRARRRGGRARAIAPRRRGRRARRRATSPRAATPPAAAGVRPPRGPSAARPGALRPRARSRARGPSARRGDGRRWRWTGPRRAPRPPRASPAARCASPRRPRAPRRTTPPRGRRRGGWPECPGTRTPPRRARGPRHLDHGRLVAREGREDPVAEPLGDGMQRPEQLPLGRASLCPRAFSMDAGDAVAVDGEPQRVVRAAQRGGQRTRWSSAGGSSTKPCTSGRNSGRRVGSSSPTSSKACRAKARSSA